MGRSKMGNVYTSQFNYKGEDRIDITWQTGLEIFRPIKELIYAYKNGNIHEDTYICMYNKMMYDSWRKNREAWEEVLQRDRITLVCHCPEDAFCHRVVLAKILTQQGATYKGEI